MRSDLHPTPATKDFDRVVVARLPSAVSVLLLPNLSTTASHSFDDISLSFHVETSYLYKGRFKGTRFRATRAEKLARWRHHHQHSPPVSASRGNSCLVFGSTIFMARLESLHHITGTLSETNSQSNGGTRRDENLALYTSTEFSQRRNKL